MSRRYEEKACVVESMQGRRTSVDGAADSLSHLLLNSISFLVYVRSSARTERSIFKPKSTMIDETRCLAFDQTLCLPAFASLAASTQPESAQNRPNPILTYNEPLLFVPTNARAVEKKYPYYLTQSHAR